MGLTVFDDQIAMTFLPSGKVLPEVHAAAWAQMKRDMDAAPKPKTKAQMRKHVEAQFLQAFGPQGFKVVKPEHCEIQLRRKTDEGYQDIRLFVKETLHNCPPCVLRVSPVLNDAAHETKQTRT